MKIHIGEKFRPYSHVAGTRVLVPGTDWIIQVFPALIRIERAARRNPSPSRPPGQASCQSKCGKELAAPYRSGESPSFEEGVLQKHSDLPIHLTGPVKEFTVQLDLERSCVWVWGIAKEGHFRFRMEGSEEGLALTVDRAPKEGFNLGGSKEKKLIASGGRFFGSTHRERLSLGSFKAQDWELVQRRFDLKEIAPALFLLGQMVPHTKEPKGGTANLLRTELDLFVRAAFSDLLVPRLEDTQYQSLSGSDGKGEPVGLLPATYQWIRSFLIEEKAPSLHILPHLPIDWDAGRAVGLRVGVGEIDLEWSRRTLRRMVFRVERNCDVNFLFQKQIDSYRINGKRQEIQLFEASKTYVFDRFQK
jgi:hypothetical protein